METEIPRAKLDAPQTLLLDKEAEHELYQRQTAKVDEVDYSRTSNLLLPIFSLPNEVLLIIFKCARYPSWTKAPGHDASALKFCHAQRSAEEHKRIDCRICRFPEMSISQVCHLWRALSLGCFELWSTFNYIGRE